jgi:two-component system chemotaxis response regulator CheB
LLSRILQRYTHLQIVDADDKEIIEPGKLYLAPAGYHLLVDEQAISLSTELPIKHAQPSIDAAFESAALSYNERLIGVVLTSSSADGALGASAIETRGGLVIVQDPQTADNATLAKAVLNSTSHAQVVPLVEIGSRLTRLCNAKGGTDAVRASR